MKKLDIYTDLRRTAKSIYEQNGTCDGHLIHISCPLSSYMKNNLIELCRCNVHDCLINLELHVITQEEFEKDTNIIRCIYKSIMQNVM